MNLQTYSVTDFKLDKMIKNPHILIIGRDKMSKAQIIHNIIQAINDCRPEEITEPTIITPSLELNDFYKSHYPNADIKSKYDTIILNNLLSQQTISIEKKIRNNKIVVFDGCIERQKSWAKDNELMEILMNGRHYRMTTIFALQYSLGITPEFKA